jgi:glycerol-3-phosphate O-acyltransferase/dihydroxyacetone phosphate acyltransferase
MFARLIRNVVTLAASLFYRLERRGAAVPDGPVLLAANHPNSLLDPILVFATAGRDSRPLAKAPLFQQRVVGRLIRGVGGIPVYRREDDPGKMGRNQETFRAAIAALHEGAAIQIFPEGRSHSDPSLSPLRTGAARMALAAEAAAEWGAGVRIVPIGITYVRKSSFRGRAVVVYGEPIAVAAYRALHEEDARAAARALTAALDRRLRALTLDLAEAEDAELIDTAEGLWALEKGLRTPRERVPLGERLPRFQAFARGLAWLRVHDPDGHRRLADAVRDYRRRTRLLGAGSGEVPERYGVGPSLRWVVERALPVVLLSPLAGLAVLAWWPPYRFVGAVVARQELPEDVVATYKVAGSLLAYPLFLGLWAAVLGWAAGWPWAVAAVLVLPAVGLVAVPWLDRARDVVDDLRLFRAVRRARGAPESLAAERQRLVAEFDALRALQEDDPPAADRRVSGGPGR